jgi:vacuolar-type H+-ATPase subunit I/STV1
MHAESQPFTPIASKPARRPMIAAHEHASPAAFDEIFANFARRQDHVERENERRTESSNELRIDAAQIRDNAQEMQRQLDRLAQLLRDIDCSA